MKIAVVGLSNAILLSQKHEVTGVGISQARVDMLSEGLMMTVVLVDAIKKEL